MRFEAVMYARGILPFQICFRQEVPLGKLPDAVDGVSTVS